MKSALAATLLLSSLVWGQTPVATVHIRCANGSTKFVQGELDMTIDDPCPAPEHKAAKPLVSEPCDGPCGPARFAAAPPKDEAPRKNFHNCSFIGGSGNLPQRFDISEIYKCDEGEVEIAGRTTMEIEYGYVYQQEMGKPSCEQPHVAYKADYDNYKWCADPGPQDHNQKRMCGDKPVTCFDGKQATWDANWQGYSCATPDHK